MNILESILAAQSGGAVKQMGQQLGIGDDQAASVLSALVPALAGGFQRNMQGTIGGGSRTSLADAIGIVAAGLGGRLAVRRLERAKGDVGDTLADTSRARRELGFAPRVGLAEGIRNEIAWYREYIAGTEGGTSSS